VLIKQVKFCLGLENVIESLRLEKISKIIKSKETKLLFFSPNYKDDDLASDTKLKPAVEVHSCSPQRRRENVLGLGLYNGLSKRQCVREGIFIILVTTIS